MGWLAPNNDQAEFDAALTALLTYCVGRGAYTPSPAQLADLMDDAVAAEAQVEYRCGPVLQCTRTHRVMASTTSTVIPTLGATVVSFVGDDGSTLDAATFVVSGQVIYRSAGIPAGVLTYQVGWVQAEIPAPVLTAARMVCRQLWRARLGNQQQRDDGVPGVGVLWPRQAEALIEPYELAPLGFA